MNYRYFVLFTFLLASTGLSLGDLAGKRPNIVLVITDDQGYGQMGSHGHPWIKTPNLDALREQSTYFSAFHVSPTCAPTRAALMTGRHPMKNGVTHTILERERMTLKATTVAQLLKKAGYTTGIFGKWHLGDEDAYQPGARGFDEVFIHGAGGIGQAYGCSCADAPKNSYFGPYVRHNGNFVKTDGFCTDMFFKGALGWIKERKEKDSPFFAYITTNAPHGPFLAPEASKKRFRDMGFDQKTAAFYGMIENIDDNVGLLMQKLNAWGLDEETLLVFMSDNGTTGGGSGRPNKAMGTAPDGTKLFLYNAGMKGMKGSANEGGTRVPALFRWTGSLRAGQEVDRVAAHIDMMPTFCAVAGAEVPESLGVEGRSLLPLLENPKAEWPDRFLFTHTGRWKTGADPNAHKFDSSAVRNQRFRFIRNKELYDIENDPGETTNVIDRHPEIVKKIRGAYDAWWAATVPLMVNEDVPMSKTRPYHEAFNKQKANGGIPAWKVPVL